MYNLDDTTLLSQFRVVAKNLQSGDPNQALEYFLDIREAGLTHQQIDLQIEALRTRDEAKLRQVQSWLERCVKRVLSGDYTLAEWLDLEERRHEAADVNLAQDDVNDLFADIDFSDSDFWAEPSSPAQPSIPAELHDPPSIDFAIISEVSESQVDEIPAYDSQPPARPRDAFASVQIEDSESLDDLPEVEVELLPELEVEPLDDPEPHQGRKSQRTPSVNINVDSVFHGREREDISRHSTSGNSATNDPEPTARNSAVSLSKLKLPNLNLARKSGGEGGPQMQSGLFNLKSLTPGKRNPSEESSAPPSPAPDPFAGAFEDNDSMLDDIDFDSFDFGLDTPSKAEAASSWNSLDNEPSNPEPAISTPSDPPSVSAPPPEEPDHAESQQDDPDSFDFDLDFSPPQADKPDRSAPNPFANKAEPFANKAEPFGQSAGASPTPTPQEPAPTEHNEPDSFDFELDFEPQQAQSTNHGPSPFANNTAKEQEHRPKDPSTLDFELDPNDPLLLNSERSSVHHEDDPDSFDFDLDFNPPQANKPDRSAPNPFANKAEPFANKAEPFGQSAGASPTPTPQPEATEEADPDSFDFDLDFSPPQADKPDSAAPNPFANKAEPNPFANAAPNPFGQSADASPTPTPQPEATEEADPDSFDFDLGLSAPQAQEPSKNSNPFASPPPNLDFPEDDPEAFDFGFSSQNAEDSTQTEPTPAPDKLNKGSDDPDSLDFSFSFEDDLGRGEQTRSPSPQQNDDEDFDYNFDANFLDGNNTRLGDKTRPPQKESLGSFGDLGSEVSVDRGLFSPHTAQQKTPAGGISPALFDEATPEEEDVGVSEDEFFDLAQDLAQDEHNRQYRGEPIVNRPTPASTRGNSDADNPFAHEAPTGVHSSLEAIQDLDSSIVQEEDSLIIELAEQAAALENEHSEILEDARTAYLDRNFQQAQALVDEVLHLNEENSEALALRNLIDMERAEQPAVSSPGQPAELTGGGLELNQVPELCVDMGALATMDLDHRSGFLIAQIDGMMTYQDLIDLSSMSRQETLQVLTDLVENGIIRNT